MTTSFTTPLLAASLALAALPAAAGPVAELAATVEKDMAAGHAANAIGDARKIVDTVWAAAPLGFATVTLVADKPGGYGNYTPRANDIYQPGEPIVLYAEPYGYGYGTADDGRYTIDFTVDLTVKSSDGEVLAELPAVLTLSTASRYKVKEFEATITYHLTGAPAGKYLLVTTMHDKNSDKAGTFETPIEIRG